MAWVPTASKGADIGLLLTRFLPHAAPNVKMDSETLIKQLGGGKVPESQETPCPAKGIASALQMQEEAIRMEHGSAERIQPST